MPSDIVVDTNVFMHAGNPTVKFFDGARAFIEALKAAKVPLCIDKPRASSAPDLGSSLIWGEYSHKMKAPTYGMAALAALAASNRLAWVSRDVGAQINAEIRALVPKNVRDQTFVRVSYNSKAKIFISDDSDDFTIAVRKKIRKQFGVQLEYSQTKFETL